MNKQDARAFQRFAKSVNDAFRRQNDGMMVLAKVIDELQERIQELEEYIAGSTDEHGDPGGG